jgi:hypothetical protein
MNSQNRNTTVLGIAAILAAASGILTAMFDGDVSTVPDWTTAGAAILSGVGLIFARDAKKE